MGMGIAARQLISRRPESVTPSAFYALEQFLVLSCVFLFVVFLYHIFQLLDINRFLIQIKFKFFWFCLLDSYNKPSPKFIIVCVPCLIYVLYLLILDLDVSLSILIVKYNRCFKYAGFLLMGCNSLISLQSYCFGVSRVSCLCHSQVSHFSPLYDVTLKFIIDFYSMHSASASEYDRQLAPYTDTLHFIF